MGTVSDIGLADFSLGFQLQIVCVRTSRDLAVAVARRNLPVDMTCCADANDESDQVAMLRAARLAPTRGEPFRVLSKSAMTTRLGIRGAVFRLLLSAAFAHARQEPTARLG